jgi:hypothetical protein
MKKLSTLADSTVFAITPRSAASHEARARTAAAIRPRASSLGRTTASWCETLLPFRTRPVWAYSGGSGFHQPAQGSTQFPCLVRHPRPEGQRSYSAGTAAGSCVSASDGVRLRSMRSIVKGVPNQVVEA